MKIFDEEKILDADYRKMIIEEIEGNENKQRKASMKKRYDIFKNNSKSYVLAKMQDEAEEGDKLANEIINRLSNISFLKQIVKKKAMVYKEGVERNSIDEKEKSQQVIDRLEQLVNFNSTMKKVNRYVELFKNAAVQVLPYKNPITEKYSYQLKVLPPYLYDVIEDGKNPEVPRAYILSYYSQSTSESNYKPENMSGNREAPEMRKSFRSGDGVDQRIADAADDEGGKTKEYIWWSNKYHLTTDEKGEIISGLTPDNNLNPIQILPFYNFAQEQDGHFWAVGGEDLVDGDILLNMLLSDLFYITKYQGMGIGYFFGKGVPKNLKVGASSLVTLEVEQDDPTPQIGFATSSPPIEAHLTMIETYVALLLSTNKLDVNTVQTKLSAQNATSGIHEMIKRADIADDITDQQEIYRDGEPKIFEVMKKWHNLYWASNSLDEEFEEIGKIDDKTQMKIKFLEHQTMTTETEKLDIIEKRRKLNLDSMIDSLMRDDQDLSETEAEKKLVKILEDKLLEMNTKLKILGEPEEEKEEDEKEPKEKEEDENGTIEA